MPRNPLDVLTQQIVAMCAVGEWRVDDLYALVRQAAPFATLPRGQLEGVLDMLSGRYPSDEFAELRPRITWDRLKGTVRAREGLQRLVVANAGTIPDRGLYGVFLADGAAEPGATPQPRRLPRSGRGVCGAGLPGAAAPAGASASSTRRWSSRAARATSSCSGASTWRVVEITRDRVLVEPAPASRAGCRSGAATGPAAPSSWARRSAGSPASCRAMPKPEARATPDRAAQPGAGRRRQPARLPGRPARRHRRRPGRPHDRDRAHPRRAWRLAALPALAVGRAGPRAVGAGAPGEAPLADDPSASSGQALKPRRSGATTASWCGCPIAARSRTPACSCPIPTRSRTWWCASLAARRCSRPTSARRPAARC